MIGVDPLVSKCLKRNIYIYIYIYIYILEVGID